ncbi:AP2 domain transcription factor AP2X-11 [Babesia caballi]|uniref:AP2 domain transcription factor AP2X-11 n=1 Tax=Babesia caballi TaxID=5871 RepID=A0AAV4M085_BABCB|nr:AP2 domain transcription factor AP2X-11 [Babesia caballi]
MMAPAYPGYEIGPPTNANANPNPNANAYGDRKVFSPNGWEKMHSVGSMPRSMESNGIHENAAFMYNNCIPPVLPDGDDGSMAPRLVYLGSLENLGDERLSDSEENPFLNAGTDVGRKAVITPRDILVYGRRDSFCLGDSPFSMKGDPRAARMLKDASLNSQINHIRATTNRPPRQQKEKNQKQPDLETYAQLAADMDKIRGVCYCRSDNSWTAWWSEKGRNRKKAFKVSRFGFYEARRMAVDHRAGVTHKPASALERRALKHDDNYEAPISDPGTELAAVRETSEASNNNELSPTTLPIQALPAPPRMETRSQHGEAFQLLETEDDVSPLSSKDSTAGNTVITEFAVGNSVTPRVALDLDPNLSSEDDSYSVMDKRRPPSEQPDVKETESVWGDSQSSGLFEERRKRKRLSSATTPERPECTEADAMEPTPTEVTLNRELLNGLKLDESTVRDVELAISNMTSDVSSVRMSGCRTVQVHPKVASMPGGDKLSVLLIRHA